MEEGALCWNKLVSLACYTLLTFEPCSRPADHSYSLSHTPFWSTEEPVICSAMIPLGAVPPLRSCSLSRPSPKAAADLFKALHPEPSLQEVPAGPLTPNSLPASLFPKDAALPTGTKAAGTWPCPQPQ